MGNVEGMCAKDSKTQKMWWVREWWPLQSQNKGGGCGEWWSRDRVGSEQGARAWRAGSWLFGVWFCVIWMEFWWIESRNVVGLSGVGLMLHCYSSIPLLSFGIGNLVCGVSGHGYDSCFFLWVCGGEREFFFPFPTHNQCHSNANLAIKGIITACASNFICLSLHFLFSTNFIVYSLHFV